MQIPRFGPSGRRFAWQGIRLEASIHNASNTQSKWANTGNVAGHWSVLNANQAGFSVNTATGRLSYGGSGGQFIVIASLTAFYDTQVATINADFVVDRNAALVGTTTSTNDAQRLTLVQSVTDVLLQSVVIVQRFNLARGDFLDIIARNVTNADPVGLFAGTLIVEPV